MHLKLMRRDGCFTSYTGRFFRTMEDASATDLDWFWRGWFYSTDVVDIGLKMSKDFISQTLQMKKLLIGLRNLVMI